jgi:hypothetical protein
MISYLIASIKNDALETTIKSIEALPRHVHEIVVVTPTPPEKLYERGSPVRYILDDKHDGSTYAFNKGAKQCLGEWIVVGIDDHVVNYDVEQFIQMTMIPPIRALDYQVINLGAAWTDCLDRNVRSHGIDDGSYPPEVRGVRWPVVTFPAVSKRTIRDKFDGHLFHPDLLHHFVDHWIGLFVSSRQPGYDLNQLGAGPYWTQHVAGEHTVRKYDDHDSRMFCKLASAFIKDPARGYTQPL